MHNVEKRYFQISANTFPRAPRFDYNPECSCSNGCEQVIELLLSDNEQIRFEEIPLSFNYTMSSKYANNSILRYEAIKNIINTVITNRDLLFKKRLIVIGKIFQNLENLSGNEAIININNYSYEDFSFITDLNSAYDIQRKLVSYYANRSISISNYASEALKYFGEDNAINQYAKAKERIYQLFPDYEIMIEKIIHNYIIFSQFFCSNNTNLLEEYSALCGVYLFLNYILLGYMANKNTKGDFIDVVAAVFRLVNHTNFNHDINILFKLENIVTIDQLNNVI